MAWSGGQYTLTATAATLTSALGLSAKLFVKNIDVTAKSTNAGNIYLGGSNVTNVPANARAEVTTTKSWSVGPYDGNFVSTDDVYIVGTASDVAFIALVI